MPFLPGFLLFGIENPVFHVRERCYNCTDVSPFQSRRLPLVRGHRQALRLKRHLPYPAPGQASSQSTHIADAITNLEDRQTREQLTNPDAR